RGEVEAPAARTRLAAARVRKTGEAERLEQVGDHRVLLRGNEARQDLTGAALPGFVNGHVQGLVLELPPEHAAAHDPVQELERARTARRFEQHDADDAVVAEAVDEPELQREVPVRRREALDL